jgi:hypothetical protein
MSGDNDTSLREFVTSRLPQLRRSAFLMCGDWRMATELTRATLARLVADSRRGVVADPDVYAYADLMEACRRRNRRREHVFVASPGAAGIEQQQDLKDNPLQMSLEKRGYPNLGYASPDTKNSLEER